MLDKITKVGVVTGVATLTALVLGGPVGLTAAGAAIVTASKEIKKSISDSNHTNDSRSN